MGRGPDEEEEEEERWAALASVVHQTNAADNTTLVAIALARGVSVLHKREIAPYRTTTHETLLAALAHADSTCW